MSHLSSRRPPKQSGGSSAELVVFAPFKTLSDLFGLVRSSQLLDLYRQRLEFLPVVVFRRLHSTLFKSRPTSTAGCSRGPLLTPSWSRNASRYRIIPVSSFKSSHSSVGSVVVPAALAAAAASARTLRARSLNRARRRSRASSRLRAPMASYRACRLAMALASTISATDWASDRLTDGPSSSTSLSREAGRGGTVSERIATAGPRDDCCTNTSDVSVVVVKPAKAISRRGCP